MSITLTDRDSGTVVLTQSGADSAGVTYSAAGGSITDYKSARVRHSGMEKGTGISRHNFRLEHRVVTAEGQRKLASVDITIAVPNDGTFTNDQVDDLATAAFSYLASETITAEFITGAARV